MKREPIHVTIVAASFLVLVLAGCSDTLSRSYYRHHPRSVPAVEQVWGTPVNTVALGNGVEKRIYAIKKPYTDLKYRYFLIKDGMVLASGITDTGPAATPKAHMDTVAFAVSDLSKAFYVRHPTTVAHLDKTWGSPACISDADDGFQYRAYAVATPYADFKYRQFMLKDGKVIASHLSPEQTCPVDTSQVVRDLEINEISHRYYTSHPMSLEQVEIVWGPPVLVRKSDNGLEKRLYRLEIPSDAAFAFRFFVIRNGMVVCSGITDTVDTTSRTTAAAKDSN